MSQSQADCAPLPGTHPRPAITRAKQERYLSVLAATGLHAEACKAAEIHPATPTLWRNKSEPFAKKHERAKELGTQVLLAAYEAQGDGFSLDKSLSFEEFCKSLNWRFFRMKRLDPAYRDNAQINVVATGPIAVNLGMRPETPRLENGESVEKSMDSDE